MRGSSKFWQVVYAVSAAAVVLVTGVLLFRSRMAGFSSPVRTIVGLPWPLLVFVIAVAVLAAFVAAVMVGRQSPVTVWPFEQEEDATARQYLSIPDESQLFDALRHTQTWSELRNPTCCVAGLGISLKFMPGDEPSEKEIHQIEIEMAILGFPVRLVTQSELFAEVGNFSLIVTVIPA